MDKHSPRRINGGLESGSERQSAFSYPRIGSMRIRQIEAMQDLLLRITSEDGRVGCLDMKAYLHCEAFSPLKYPAEFAWVSNGGYFIEWACGADLSADAVEAQWQLLSQPAISH
jgi:hypothetical protein